MANKVSLLGLIKTSWHSTKRNNHKSAKSVAAYLFGSLPSTYLLYDNADSWIRSACITLGIEIQEVPKLVSIILVLVLSLIGLFIIQLLWNLLLNTREAIFTIPVKDFYEEAIGVMNNQVGIFNSYKRQNKILSEIELGQTLIPLCEEVQSLYFKKINSIVNTKGKKKKKIKVGVSIMVVKKILENNSEFKYTTEVRPFVRDRETENKRQKNKPYHAIKHTITTNTCYEKIIEKYNSNKKNKSLSFFSNDLPKIKPDEYKNSSFDATNFDSFSEGDWSNEQFRRDNWPVDYRSEIVVAISPLLFNQSNLPIIGFICIHSNATGTNLFTKGDVRILEGISEVIYDSLLNAIKTQTPT